jgi:hypothetical protein
MALHREAGYMNSKRTMVNRRAIRARIVLVVDVGPAF